MKWEFWRWLTRGLNNRSGLYQLWDFWLVAHIMIGVGVAIAVEVPMHEAARVFLLPLVAIFVGLSFAWVGSAQALLQEPEIEALAEYHSDGICTYVYTFQLAILIILVTLVMWGLAGLRVFDNSLMCREEVQISIESTLYFFASLTLRECWHVVIGSQELILIRHKIREINNQDS